jgi:hypothetical protein
VLAGADSAYPIAATATAVAASVTAQRVALFIGAPRLSRAE